MDIAFAYCRKLENRISKLKDASIQEQAMAKLSEAYAFFNVSKAHEGWDKIREACRIAGIKRL